MQRNDIYNLDLRSTNLRPLTSLRSLSTIRFRRTIFTIIYYYGMRLDVTCNTFLLRHGPNRFLVDDAHFHEAPATERLENVLGVRVVFHGVEHVLAGQREELGVADGADVGGASERLWTLMLDILKRVFK